MESEKTVVSWLGQSCVKIISPTGKVILIDPWQKFPPGNALFPAGFSISDADYILVTHGHLDHLGDTVELAKASDARSTLKVITNFELELYLMEQGIGSEKLVSMNIGGTVVVDTISITMVRADHSSGIGPFAPKGLSYGGLASGYIIKLEDGTVLYHTGDTDVFSDMELIAKRFHPDVVFLPIGGVYTMDPQSAVMALSLIRPKVAIPIHYAGSFQLPGKPEDFAQIAGQKLEGQVRILIPKPGESIQIP